MECEPAIARGQTHGLERESRSGLLMQSHQGGGTRVGEDSRAARQVSWLLKNKCTPRTCGLGVTLPISTQLNPRLKSPVNLASVHS